VRLARSTLGRSTRYGFFTFWCWEDWAAEMRSAAVLRASWMWTDCSASTCCAVVTAPDATCIAADLICGSLAMRCPSAWSAAASSSSDFWSSGDGLKSTVSADDAFDFPTGSVPGC